MPISSVARSLSRDPSSELAGYYGDPCYQADWSSTVDECKNKTKYNFLALHVLEHYGLSWNNAPSANNYTACCPLDILNQDPFACIRMSLQAKLTEGELWECYCDPFGEAVFVKVLSNPNFTGLNEVSENLSGLPPVRYCVPSYAVQDIADLVIVRSADPPPFRRCGLSSNTGQTDIEGNLVIDSDGWIVIVDPTHPSTRLRDSSYIYGFGSSFNGIMGVDPGSPIGLKFSWGEVNGNASRLTSSTCDNGMFKQFGTIVYPDFERKQVYNDGIIDLTELDGFEDILFWLKDLTFTPELTDAERRHYTIQFVKSTEVPVDLAVSARLGTSCDWLNPDTAPDEFGPTCDFGSDRARTSLNQTGTNNSTGSCTSIQTAISRGLADANTVSWGEYIMPSFFAYANAESRMNFNDLSKWNSVGTDLCLDNQIDNIYESTSEIMGNGCLLNDWRASYYGTDNTYLDFGTQQELRTYTVSNENWVEKLLEEEEVQEGKIKYLLRSQAPHTATFKSAFGFGGTTDWQNAFCSYMFEAVNNRYGGMAASTDTFNFSTSDYWENGGVLFGMDDGLYTMSEWWAKITVSRPGIWIRGYGKDVEDLLDRIKLRVLPVYRVDFPEAVAADGNTWPPDPTERSSDRRCDDERCVDPYSGLLSSMYCAEPTDVKSDMELLQEAQSGGVIDITLPFLFPDWTTEATSKQYCDLCKLCGDIATNFWEYIEKWNDEPVKGLTYTCGPPRTQAEVPELGKLINTPYGLRTINSISYQYTDESSFLTTIEVGPVSITQAQAGSLNRKRTKDAEVKGRVISHEYGALYKVNVPGIGVVKAWNMSAFPYDAGDRVTVSLYNHPVEV